MIRAAVISLLASPACAATLPAIQIEECVAISAKDMARDAVERVDVCEWPGPVDNPLPYDMLADLKGPQDTPPSPVEYGRAVLPVAPFLSWSRNVQAATGGAFTVSFFPVGASSFSSSEARCGCVTEPDKSEPSPVPLPAGLPLYAALMGALGVLWRWRG